MGQRLSLQARAIGCLRVLSGDGEVELLQGHPAERDLADGPVVAT